MIVPLGSRSMKTEMPGAATVMLVSSTLARDRVLDARDLRHRRPLGLVDVG
jgi:hypothetical protein